MEINFSCLSDIVRSILVETCFLFCSIQPCKCTMPIMNSWVWLAGKYTLNKRIRASDAIGWRVFWLLQLSYRKAGFSGSYSGNVSMIKSLVSLHYSEHGSNQLQPAEVESSNISENMWGCPVNLNNLLNSLFQLVQVCSAEWFCLLPLVVDSGTVFRNTGLGLRCWFGECTSSVAVSANATMRDRCFSGSDFNVFSHAFFLNWKHSSSNL